MSTQLNEALKKFNKNTSHDELIEAMQNQPYLAGIPPHEVSAFLTYIQELISIKNQESLLKEQNEFNIKLLKQNRDLVIATWVLAGATILLAIITLAG